MSCRASFLAHKWLNFVHDFSLISCLGSWELKSLFLWFQGVFQKYLSLTPLGISLLPCWAREIQSLGKWLQVCACSLPSKRRNCMSKATLGRVMGLGPSSQKLSLTGLTAKDGWGQSGNGDLQPTLGRGVCLIKRFPHSQSVNLKASCFPLFSQLLHISPVCPSFICPPTHKHPHLHPAHLAQASPLFTRNISIASQMSVSILSCGQLRSSSSTFLPSALPKAQARSCFSPAYHLH